MRYGTGLAPGGDTMRVMTSQGKLLLTALLFAACARPDALTAEKAEEILLSTMFQREPVYAEVPQRVTYGPKSPKDDYDGKAVATLQNLERAGLITLAHSVAPDGTETWQGTTTKQGFQILGTMPSARGPVFRARIAEKRIDGVRNFVRHPSEPTTGSAEVVWHYDAPTPYYEMFETKINKPLQQPFVSLASIYWDKGWRFHLTVKKTQSGPAE